MSDLYGPKNLLKGIDSSLRDRFKQIREQRFNQNAKGGNYERIVADFLESYLGSLFDFHTRAALIDRDLRVYRIYSPGENEFDVVATFKSASPRIVFKLVDTEFIPLDAVAFIVEVKQTLSKSSLEADLSKLGRLNELDCSKRFSVSFTGNLSIERPLKTLFYYETEIAADTLGELLTRNLSSWDLVVRYSDDVVLGNCALPVVAAVDRMDKHVPIVSLASHSLLVYLLWTQSSMTFAPIVSTLGTFLTLLKTAGGH